MFQAKGSSPFGDFMAVSPTNACPLRCRHCISHSEPSAATSENSFVEDLDKFFSHNPFQTSCVSLTGGEPLLDLDQARGLIDMLSRKSIRCLVVTSAYWAKNIETTRRVFTQLDGLSGITISYDIYHAEFVGLHFVQNAYIVAKERGIPTRIRLVRSFPPTAEDEALLVAINSFAHGDDLEVQRLINYGRARNKIETAGHSSPVMTFCPSTGPHISHEGTVTPCCNSIISIKGQHPLQLGSIVGDGPGKVYEKFRNSVLLLSLKTEGKSYFQDALRQRGFDVEDMQICDLCYKVCSDPELWNDLRSNLFSRQEVYRLYTNAVTAFGFKEFQYEANEAAKAAILEEMEHRITGVLQET